MEMFDRCAPGEGVMLGAYAEMLDTDDWIDVAVPGDVHQALIAAGRIPDPGNDHLRRSRR
jgi:hypothetical protein